MWVWVSRSLEVEVWVVWGWGADVPYTMGPIMTAQEPRKRAEAMDHLIDCLVSLLFCLRCVGNVVYFWVGGGSDATT